LKHLHSCQFFDLPSVPQPPKQKPFTCSK
jgi:hypothetical protein